MRAVTPAGDEYTKGFQQHAAKGYNTAVVLGRDGEFVGYYRKAWPCCPDQDGNSMDDGYPSREMVKTFDLDFGRLGIQVQSGSRHFHSITPMQNQKASCKGLVVPESINAMRRCVKAGERRHLFCRSASTSISRTRFIKCTLPAWTLSRGRQLTEEGFLCALTRCSTTTT